MCFAQVARLAAAVEHSKESCRTLSKRSVTLAEAGRGNFSVRCDSYERAPLDADVITWWQQQPLCNDPGERTTAEGQLWETVSFAKDQL